ncbi:MULTISPECIES: acyltransferase [unclassified Streptomyces]|uniref:acyltransferase n=1 Tax=unclassified Streptomyces TaxID=2593676 RepID=UPI000DAF265C|nr:MULTISPECIES: transferase hexapeptide repeat family protein [unclassified Streptomyces]PZT77624.1 phenylacetic acid degradation protein PaaY [Streptomyces sp. AC1-42W]PZT78422.1 phenylacetic acid degradation protein PaaY [Streptomyces sp. AC1-42T]
MAHIYSFEGTVPVVHPTAFVHPDAVLIGSVDIGPGCYVGPLASLRGDFGHIELRTGCNVQDGCVLHCFPGADTVVEEDGHVGHGSVLHGCRVGRDSLIGMKSVLMDGVVVGRQAFVGAGSFVKSRFHVPERHLVAGSPARVVRELTADEIAWKANGTLQYQKLAQRCLSGLHPARAATERVEPLPSAGAGGPEHVTLHAYRSR